MSYRVRRRAFLASLGGAVGFSSLLSQLEAAAEGASGPPRFLLMYWPVGTIPYRFLPEGEGRNYVVSPILQPFELAGLREDLVAVYGLQDITSSIGGGGSEAGVVMRTTCADSHGTRLSEGGEADDAVAGGPSIDQILLRHIPSLGTLHRTPVNAICDARVDAGEISSQCLSYSYETREVASATPGGMLTEHTPLMPELSPAKLYTSLFANFMPGGESAELALALKLKRSVLDYSQGELKELHRLAPSSEREKLDMHAESIRELERSLSQAESGMLSCPVPQAPPAGLVGKSGSQQSYDMPDAAEADDERLAELGRQHLNVIRVAFQCDVTRVATFQWMPATNHVAFGGQYPGDPDAIKRHHPLSHRAYGSDPHSEPGPGDQHDIHEFLANVHTWLNARTAEALLQFKNTPDGYGGSLLDHTVIPFVTDTASFDHARSPLPALLFGGRALGLRGGQFLNFASSPRPFGDFWLTVAQAFLKDQEANWALEGEIFMQQHGSSYRLLPGVWEQPG